MIKEGKIGFQETISLITIAISAKVFFSSPAVLAGLIGNTGYYSTLISAAIALLGFYFIYLLLKRFPGKDIVEIFHISFGRVLGFILSFILGIYMLFNAIIGITEFTEFIKVYVIPLSPNWFIVGIFIVCVYVLSILGLETIARLSKLVIFFLLAGFLILLALGSINYNINNLFPIFGYGLDKIAYHSFLRSSVYGEVIILAIFSKSFQGASFIKREGIMSILVSAGIISISLLASALTFPYYIGQEMTSPIYSMSTLIDYGRFLQRVEPVFLYIWIISNFIAAAIFFYSFIWIFCQAFQIPDKKPIVLGSCIILYALSLIHRDIITIIMGYVPLIRNYGALLLFVLPLIALIVASIRKVGGNSKCVN